MKAQVSKVLKLFAVVLVVLLCLFLVAPLAMPSLGAPPLNTAQVAAALAAGVLMAGVVIMSREVLMKARPAVKSLYSRVKTDIYFFRRGMVAWLNRVIKIPMLA